ncbi:MAG: hypothetical protein CSA18_01760 [Deltaproteobacteria bacterium]|nr:MAG: hypothetical protein CSA18_01760 [Deltaproteobacteria bacterium]
MKILVTLKAVAENIPESDPEFLKKIFFGKNKNLKINKFDDHALEEAVKIKNTDKNTIIHTITIGNKNCDEILKKAIGKGADKGFLIVADTNKSNDPEFVSKALSLHFKKDNYDFLFSGMMSEDMMSGISVHMTAGRLDIPSFSGVTEIHSINKNEIIFSRETEGGSVDKISAKLPAALGFQAGINKPSYPNVLKMIKTDEDSIIITDYKKIFEKKESIKVSSVNSPPQSRKAEFIRGDISEKADNFIKILQEKKVLQEKK